MEFLDNGRSFQETYKCFPVAMLPGNEREDLERGGKSKHFVLIITDFLPN